MSLLRTGIVIAAVIMLLPAEEKKQAALTATATRASEQSATFCERNPSTCATARDTWALFLRKAEYGMELTARMVRQQLFGQPPVEPANARSAGGHQQQPVAIHQPQFPASAPVHPAATPQEAPARRTYPMDYPRWR